MALLSPIDAAFLLSESRATPMHVGGLQVFELPSGVGPDWLEEQYRQMLDSADQVAPLFLKRPYRALTTGGQWAWQDDSLLDLEYHVRHSALPGPRRVRELLALASRLHGSLLDRQRPLWEYHLIEGLEGNRFATYTKIHHSVVDGVSALRLLERTLSTDPEADVAPMWTHRRRSGSRPDEGSDPVDLIRGVLRGGVDLAMLTPAALRTVRSALENDLAAYPFKAPPTMLNVHITGARRLAAQSWDLSRLRAVAAATGATLNDVVLAMSAGALRAYLVEQDALPSEPLTSMVPVSTRRDDSAGGNAVGAVITSLATDTADAGLRLERIRSSMALAKESLEGLSVLQVLALSAVNTAPAPLVSLLGGGEGFRPPFNVTISNVPGPRQPLYWNGARLQGIYPASIPFHGQALNITVTSYVDRMEFGLTGCRRRVPHLQRMLAQLETSLADLEVAAGVAGGGATARKGRPTSARR